LGYTGARQPAGGPVGFPVFRLGGRIMRLKSVPLLVTVNT
jgi:hypothetical protein